MEDGSEQWYYIPITLMRGEKEFPEALNVNVLKDWPWTNSNYNFKVPGKVRSIEIDPSQNMMDANLDNNNWKALED